VSLFTSSTRTYSSPKRSLLLSFWRSRQSWKRKFEELKQREAETRKQHDAAIKEAQRLRQELRERDARLEQLQNSLADHSPHECWTNLPGHQFSAELIALCCQLAQLIGFRAVPKVLSLFSQTLGLDLPMVTRDSVRNWTCRSGVALLENENATDWIWLIDHSVQLGKMCVLVVLGVRQSQLPYQQDSASRPLRSEDMRVLAVLPAQSRNKQQVIDQLAPLAERLGQPLAVVCDGASELKAATESLQNTADIAENAADVERKANPVSVVHLVDVKHKIASGLKRLLAGDEVFNDFSRRAAASAARIRQTDLDHLQPPHRKDKCRFMNIQREIRWAKMVLAHLDRYANSRDEYAELLREKLGWLCEFRDAIEGWREWVTLIGETLSLSNQHGVYRGGGLELRRRLDALAVDVARSDPVRQIVTSAYAENEAKLHLLPNTVTCLPCSTELLESVFGRYKAMQRHHHRGTFTTLLAALPTLLHTFTAESIREQFTAVSNRSLKQWLAEQNLLNSTQSRRAKAYAEA